MNLRLLVPLALASASLFVGRASASFHFMQIEQVIGGIEGDNTAQAIQLRMRSGGQNILGAARIRAWDAAGANPVLVIDFTSGVPNGATGDRVLIVSPKFQQLFPTIGSDFTLTNLIPADYLGAGKLTFEDDSGLVYWSLAWGGAAFTGANTGSNTNDDDGNFGAPFAGALPASAKLALAFTGSATDQSTTNASQYALTGEAATIRNNAGETLALGATPPVLVYQGTAALQVGTPATSLKRTGKAFLIVDTATFTASLVQTFKGASGKHQITLLNAPLHQLVTNAGKTVTFTRGTSSGSVGIAGYMVEFDDFFGVRASLRTGQSPPATFQAPATLKGTVDRRNATASAELTLHSKIVVTFNTGRTQAANDGGLTAPQVLAGIKQDLAALGFSEAITVD